jgi:hypothetical protein
MRVKLLALVAVAAVATPAPAQSIAVLNVAFYNAGATLRESSDSVKAMIATEKLRDSLSRVPGIHVIDTARTAAAEASRPALDAADGKPCNVIVACARAVGRVLSAPWVVMAKVSKTSNLIWVLSGELIDVASGKLLLDDEFELKGDANTMVPAGIGLFAARVAKRARGPQS